MQPIGALALTSEAVAYYRTKRSEFNEFRHIWCHKVSGYSSDSSCQIHVLDLLIPFHWTTIEAGAMKIQCERRMPSREIQLVFMSSVAALPPSAVRIEETTVHNRCTA